MTYTARYQGRVAVVEQDNFGLRHYSGLLFCDVPFDVDPMIDDAIWPDRSMPNKCGVSLRAAMEWADGAVMK